MIVSMTVSVISAHHDRYCSEAAVYLRYKASRNFVMSLDECSITFVMNSYLE
jgi:hypothetical protein